MMPESGDELKLVGGEEYLVSGRLEPVVLPYAFQGFPIGIGDGSLSVPFAILEFTNVFAPIGRGMGALSV